MLRTGIVLLALAGLSSAANWELYKSVHGKSYAPTEDSRRRQIFEKRWADINAHNLRHDLGLTTFRMGVNRFSDLTDEEVRKFRGLAQNASKVNRSGEPFAHESITADLPLTVDWRKKGYVTPVKDQQQCGSCWAFSATGSLEGQHFKKTGKLVSLSEQNLIDCSVAQGNMGCNGGLMDHAFQYVRQNGGLDTEKSYPYEATGGECRFEKQNVGTKCVGYVDIPVGSESALKKAVATVGPISVAIDASHDSFQSYSGGIYDEPECSSETLDHGVLVVGYGTDNGVDYWLVKNSWNTSWGVQGYIKMARNKGNQCGIASMASYPKV